MASTSTRDVRLKSGEYIMQWEVVIGLEIHAQLNTKSKIFSGASTQFGATPNEQACAIDLGFPGVLPVLNEAVVEKAVKFGLATGCKIAKRSVFDRKNYFYPDLPKGYQISQFELPIVHSGYLDIQIDENDENSVKRIGIMRAHLEEDAGKSLHEDFHNQSGIDLNRAGTPLLEIVSEPDMRSPEEAVAYLKSIHALVRYLDICDGNMAEGSFRCDVNISIRPKGQTELGTRTEMKNINSFRFVDQAIRFEVQRQIELIESGHEVVQQTRLYDSIKQETRPMRSKEEANDYRYFPDPDLLPIVLTDDYIARIQSTLPELPTEKCQRFQDEYKLTPYDARYLTQNRDLAHYFESTLQHQASTQIDPKLTANWVMGSLMGALSKANLSIIDSPISSETLAQLLSRISDNTISGKIAKSLFEDLWAHEGTVDALIDKKGLKQVTDSSEIEAMVDEIIATHPGQVEQFRQGKDKMFGFFVGQVMKASKGKANPKQVNDILKDKLK
tara:strand:- start:14816 stop:16318 length:1503 start_codon:yes stop_codon:yes gene_type:complete